MTASLVTDTPQLDAAGSAAIGCLLAAVALGLARRMKSLLIGESASDEDLDTIRHIVHAHDHVQT